MTISSETRIAGPYVGNGVTTAFPFTFKVFATADLLVVRTDLTPIETDLVEITDYTIALNADQDVSPGGTINCVVAPPAGYLLTATSHVEDLQPEDIQNAGGFYPQVIEDALDRLTILIQQVKLLTSRGVTLPLSSVASSELPFPEANRLIGWDNLGTALQNYGGLASSPVSGAMAPVIAALTLALARTAMGVAASGANADITSLAGLSAGSASAPSITPTGDSNTGVFFPAADTLAVSTGGNEALRVLSTQRLVCGASVNAWTERLAVRPVSSSGEAVGLYTPSTSYTGTLMRLQTETAAGTGWNYLQLIGSGGSNTTFQIDGGGNALVKAATGSIGYGTGAGGTVTQATSKSTAVTLNKPTGRITMHNAALGAGATVSFTFNNSLAIDADGIVVWVYGASFIASYIVRAGYAGVGLFTVTVKNDTAGSLSDSVGIGFAVIKGATS